MKIDHKNQRRMLKFKYDLNDTRRMVKMQYGRAYSISACKVGTVSETLG